jgi:hypothetical protein
LANLHAGDPRVFLQLIERLIVEETRTPGLLRVLRGAAQGERYLRDLRKRVLQLLADPLEAAKAAGLVRANVQLDDVPIIFAMLEGPVDEAATSGRPSSTRVSVSRDWSGRPQCGLLPQRVIDWGTQHPGIARGSHLDDRNSPVRPLAKDRAQDRHGPPVRLFNPR